MPPFFQSALQMTWLAFVVYWLWSARSAKRVALQESWIVRLTAYWLPLIIAVMLLGPHRRLGPSILHEQFLPHDDLVLSLGLALAVAGVALAIFSRAFLGRNWSATVQLKQDHELITDGPYRYVRHPIYTGLLLLFAGNAVMIGQWRGVLAVAIVFVSFWRKLKVEEKWLAGHFGESYSAYRSRTKALIPAIF